MPKKLKIGNALIADYVAEGLGGKYTIVNAIGGDVKVQAFPTAVSFGLLAEIIIQEGQPSAIDIDVRINGKRLLGGNGEISDAHVVGETATLSIAHFTFPLKEEAVLELYFSAEGFQRTLAMRKRIFLDPDFFHRFSAALRAISARRSGVIFAARAFPPFRPSSAAAEKSSLVSSISPVAILATMTARDTASAGRFSPRGPLGILRPNQAFLSF